MLASKWFKIGCREYDIEQLKPIVGAENYKAFADFRKRVLEPAEEELKNHTSFLMNWEVTRKQGKSPQALTFSFTQNKPKIDERLRQPFLPFGAEHYDPNLANAFILEGIPEEEAIELVASDPDYARYVLDRVREQKTKSQKSIRNHETYTRAIIEGERDNYRAIQNQQKLESEQRQKAQQEERKKEKAGAEKKQEEKQEQENRKSEAEAYLASLDTEGQKKIVDEFYHEEIENHPVFGTMWKDGKYIKSGMGRIMFLLFVWKMLNK